MGQEEAGQVRCTPTDPSIEFDVLEEARLRLGESLTGGGGYGPVRAKATAEYFMCPCRNHLDSAAERF